MLYKRKDVSNWFTSAGYDFLGRHFSRRSGVRINGVDYLDMDLIRNDWSVWYATRQDILIEDEIRQFQSEVVGFIPKESIL